MPATAALLASLDAIAHEITVMLDVLDRERTGIPDGDRREVKRRILEIRGRTQELFEWLSAARLEEPQN